MAGIVTRQGALLSAVHTYLMIKPSGGSAYELLCDVNTAPSPDGGIPDAVYSKNLSQRTPKSTQGWYTDDSSRMEFEADYDKTTYTDLLALAGSVQSLGIWFGGTEVVDPTTGETTVTPTGSEGKWQGTGTIAVSVGESETDGLRTMTIAIDKVTPFAFVS